jgi:hypothetical protein
VQILTCAISALFRIAPICAVPQIINQKGQKKAHFVRCTIIVQCIILCGATSIDQNLTKSEYSFKKGQYSF